MSRGKRKFTERQVRLIREAYAGGTGQGVLAFYWSVNKKGIQDIVHGRTYKNVDGPRSSKTRICPTCRQIVGVRASHG